MAVVETHSQWTRGSLGGQISSFKTSWEGQIERDDGTEGGRSEHFLTIIYHDQALGDVKPYYSNLLHRAVASTLPGNLAARWDLECDLEIKTYLNKILI